MPFHGLIANEDLSTKQFYAVKFVGGAENDFKVELMDEADGDSEAYAGILLNKPKANEAATVSRPEDQSSKVKLGADVVAGAKLMVDVTDGTLITRTGANQVVAISPVNAVDGEVIVAFLM